MSRMPFIQNRSQFPRNVPEEVQPDVLPLNAQIEDRWPVSNQRPTTSGAESHPSPPLISHAEKDDPLAAALLGIADVSSRLLVTHPSTVLRRQCQVHQNAHSLHLTPFSLVPIVFKIVGKEGVTTLWKGSLGTCVVWGLSGAVETVIADVLGLPRNIVQNGSTEKFLKHLILKASTFFVLTPFFVSSFTETVRSVSGLGSDDIRVFEVLSRGVDRLRFPVFSARDASKRFSVLHLAIPTVGFRTTHFMIETLLYQRFLLIGRQYVGRKSEVERSKYHQFIPLIFARLSSTVITDLILFPIETVLHRMYIQGTRTLIDNLDTGVSACSITVKYSGFFDCLRSIVRNEGFSALYSGVGALALQYLLHFGLHQLVRSIFDRGSEVLRKATANQRIVTPPLSTNGSFTMNGPLSGPLSGPFVQPFSTSPVTSPRKQSQNVNIMTPPRDPTQFPTFGESAAHFDTPFAPFHSNRPNVFGSPPTRTNDRASPLPPLSLNTDRLGDPFSGSS